MLRNKGSGMLGIHRRKIHLGGRPKFQSWRYCLRFISISCWRRLPFRASSAWCHVPKMCALWLCLPRANSELAMCNFENLPSGQKPNAGGFEGRARILVLCGIDEDEVVFRMQPTCVLAQRSERIGPFGFPILDSNF